MLPKPSLRRVYIDDEDWCAVVLASGYQIVAYKGGEGAHRWCSISCPQRYITEEGKGTCALWEAKLRCAHNSATSFERCAACREATAAVEAL
jgi:hypothetical protein